MQSQTTRNEWSRATTIAVSCFAIGIGGALLGSVLTVISWAVGAEVHPWLRALGTGFLILIIPLLILAGYCLDKTEEAPDKKRHDQAGTREQGSAEVPLLGTLALAFCLLLLVSAELKAQQTIFNLPTADVLDKGKVYLELDASLKPTDGAAVSKFSSFVPRVVVGAGNRIEIGLNVTGNIQPGPDSTTLVPTIKWKPYSSKDDGWDFVVGNNLFVPVRNRAYNAGNYVYAQISKTFNSGTRVTFGGYDFTRNVVASANRAGSQFGFEQPLNKKVTFAGDWYTGKHTAGYFTPGVIFKLGPKVTGYASYSIGNTNASNGNHFFLLELGYNIN